MRGPQIDLLWCDEVLLAVNKPAGLLTIPDGYNPTLPHLAGLLEAQFGRIWVVHRLDKDTSGVILFARNADVHRELNVQFANRETCKTYHAIVVGEPGWQETEVCLPLTVNGDRGHRTIIDPRQGKSAETHLSVLERYVGFSLVIAEPHTGYTHQIRAHLAAIGLPILRDPLYRSLRPLTPAQIQAARIMDHLPIRRTALHAFRLSFTHPITHLRQEIEAPEPEDFCKTRQNLCKE
jgi:tRNA pseudouridine32 synthase / 23S rRNA pseudouridine746 synthase